MAGPTRRTHVVRIMDKTEGGGSYVDVEVLDAISFKDERGKEMILNMPQANVVAYIKDDTGGNNGREPSNPTRLSHMKRIVGDDPQQRFDVEVLDIASFRDVSGQEWILDMNSVNGEPSVFNTTDRAGDSKATRRVHTETISSNLLQKPTSDFLTVERCDTIAFRTVLGKELIIKCPSNDDLLSSDPRAPTSITSPPGYDPTNPNGPTPPDNTDSNQYVKFIKGGGPFTGKTKISQGPFWWIRNVSELGGLVFMTFHYKAKSQDLPARYETDVVGMPFKVDFDLLDDGNNFVWSGSALAHKDVPIVQPTPNDAMRSKYHTWSPTRVWEAQSSKIDTATMLIIDVGNWEATINGFINGQVVGPPTTYANAEQARTRMLNAWLAADLSPGTPPDYPEFQVRLEAGAGVPPDADFYANGGVTHTETISGITHVIEARSTLILNTNLIKKTLDRSHKDDPTFTFRVLMARPSARTSVDWELMAEGYLAKDRKTFPVDSDNKPIWDDWNPTVASLSQTTRAAFVDVTINFKTLNVTMALNGRGGLG